MKCRQIIFALLPLVISSCTYSPFSKDKTLLLDAGFVFEHEQTAEGEQLATLLFNDSYYSFSSELRIDKPIVAGDQLSIVFNGDYEYVCRETYPAQCDVRGEIKSHSLIETKIIGVHVDDASIRSAKDSINGSYILDNEYVILDEKGKYTTLDNYKGNDLYLSENIKKMTELCTCPKGAQCEPCPIYIAGLYAFNPRPNKV